MKRLFTFFVLTAALLAGPPAAFAQELLKLANISCRAPVGASPLIGGFVIKSERLLLLRAVGPSLQRFGVNAYCRDPAITLHNQRTGQAITTNDNWVDSAEMRAVFASVGAFPLSHPNEAAILITLPAGEYSAVVTCDPAQAGVALVEVYDTQWFIPGGFANLSVRGMCGTGENILIPGFVTGGQGSAYFLFRAVGPGLAQFGVTDYLPDPSITVMSAGDGSFIEAENDDWQPRYSNFFFQSKGAFPLPDRSKDSAATFGITTMGGGPRSSFGRTVLVRDTSGASGQVLAEVYIYP